MRVTGNTDHRPTGITCPNTRGQHTAFAQHSHNIRTPLELTHTAYSILSAQNRTRIFYNVLEARTHSRACMFVCTVCHSTGARVFGMRNLLHVAHHPRMPQTQTHTHTRSRRNGVIDDGFVHQPTHDATARRRTPSPGAPPLCQPCGRSRSHVRVRVCVLVSAVHTHVNKPHGCTVCINFEVSSAPLIQVFYYCATASGWTGGGCMLDDMLPATKRERVDKV